MHYIVNDYIIESELAAKSTKQTNRIVLDFISNLPSNIKVLDYGCGKLRYSIPLAKQTSKVIAIDSLFQIEKKQLIEDSYTAPKDYIHKNLTIKCVDSNEWKNEKYDIVFCTNVLSAIPHDEDRLKIISDSRLVLNKEGFLFIAVQYRNSYFDQYNYRKDTIKYNDGWLIKRGNNKCSFYGIITSEKIINLCDEAGFNYYEITKHDGSCYIKAYVKKIPS